MHWYFRDISDDPSEKELTQQDQFNNDEVALAEQFFNGVELLVVEALSHRHSAGPETDHRGVHNLPRYVLSCRATAMLSDFDPSCVSTFDWYTL